MPSQQADGVPIFSHSRSIVAKSWQLFGGHHFEFNRFSKKAPFDGALRRQGSIRHSKFFKCGLIDLRQVIGGRCIFDRLGEHEPIDRALFVCPTDFSIRIQRFEFRPQNQSPFIRRRKRNTGNAASKDAILNFDAHIVIVINSKLIHSNPRHTFG